MPITLFKDGDCTLGLIDEEKEIGCMAKSEDKPSMSTDGITSTTVAHATDLTLCTITCVSNHMTDFSIQEFSPAYGVEMLLDSNLSKLDEGLNDSIFKGFAFYTVCGLWGLLIIGMIWGKMKDNESKRMKKLKKGINIADHLHLNKYGEGSNAT